MRKYLKPNLEIVEPGRHDVIGTKHGDGTAMVRNDAAQWVARAWSAGRASASSGAGLKIATDGVIGFESGDVNGDGDDDLIWFRKTGAKSGEINVAISDGANYGSEATWWQGDTLVPLDGAKLLVADFHADGRTDVALLGKGAGAGTSRLIVFRRKPPGDAKKFGDPSQWWASGSHDHDKTAAAWAGDLSGDGRADLIIRQNPSAGGVRVKTAVTKSPPPGGDQKMQGLKTRFDAGGLTSAKVKMIAGDANRDGREDVLLLVGGSGQAKVERLQGQLLGGFKRVKIWTTPKSSPIPVAKTRLGIADIDYDGRTDLVLYIKRDGGTRVRVLKTRYDEMKPGDEWQESFGWSAVRPY